MESIPLPTKIEYTPGSKPNETFLTIEPLYPGYGLTIGIALRRILLSSLSGGAIVAVKIKGAEHEFSTLPYVKEDVVDIILNLKKVRFRLHTDEQVRVTLRAKGEKIVTTADIDTTSDVEIASSEATICTLTNKNAQIEIDLFVRRDRGYLPTENREKEKLEIGTIAIDALFMPIRNVSLNFQNVRVGQMTHYNRATLGIETDGSISATEAVHEACKILLDHFSLIMDRTDGSIKSIAQENISSEDSKEKENSVTISDQDDEEVADDSQESDEPKKRGRPKKNS